jgi:hypothetical protein
VTGKSKTSLLKLTIVRPRLRLTHAMIEALRRVHKNIDLNKNPGVCLSTIESLQSRGFLTAQFNVVGADIRVDARLTPAGLRALLLVADVKLESWRLVP